jgi:phosphate-selective porin OprO/OprP
MLAAVKPSGPDGAWGLSLRYDHLDLNDKNIVGGEETDLSAAVTWWPNANLKFMAQYTASRTTKGAVDDDPRLLQLRGQVMF